jgi:hypothetical protein
MAPPPGCEIDDIKILRPDQRNLMADFIYDAINAAVATLSKRSSDHNL